MLYPLSYGGSDADTLLTTGNPNGSALEDLPLIHGPSPPDAVHERGSQGSSASSALVGGANPLAVVVEVVVVGAAVVVVVVPPFGDFDFLGGVVFLGAVVVVVAALGGFTEKLVPVSTVTSAPPRTMEGLKPRVTDPEMEFATSCAAATTAADFEP